MAILIGCAQVLALVPGVSRSGVTMTAALLLGMDRQASARFSFLLSIPIIASAGLLKVWELVPVPLQSTGCPRAGRARFRAGGLFLHSYFFAFT